MLAADSANLKRRLQEPGNRLLRVLQGILLLLAIALNSEAVASQVAGMLVGSIGLIAAMPLTTAIATALALRTDPGLLKGEEVHAH